MFNMKMQEIRLMKNLKFINNKPMFITNRINIRRSSLPETLTLNIKSGVFRFIIMLHLTKIKKNTSHQPRECMKKFLGNKNK